VYFCNQEDNTNAEDAFNSYLQDSAIARIYRNAYNAQCGKQLVPCSGADGRPDSFTCGSKNAKKTTDAMPSVRDTGRP
jgi:hypothetical protein